MTEQDIFRRAVTMATQPSDKITSQINAFNSHLLLDAHNGHSRSSTNTYFNIRPADPVFLNALFYTAHKPRSLILDPALVERPSNPRKGDKAICGAQRENERESGQTRGRWGVTWED